MIRTPRERKKDRKKLPSLMRRHKIGDNITIPAIDYF
jgi:hypothetical protein